MESGYKSKINPKNQAFAEKIRELIKANKIVGIVDVESLPAAQFQKIRATLRGKAEILIVKKNLIKLVLNESEKTHKNINKLIDSMSGIVGLLFTNDKSGVGA